MGPCGALWGLVGSCGALWGLFHFQGGNWNTPWPRRGGAIPGRGLKRCIQTGRNPLKRMALFRLELNTSVLPGDLGEVDGFVDESSE